MKVTRAKPKRLKRRSASHKGDNGRALVIGGSVEFIGAPALAGLAALRSGCDLVTVAAPEKAAWAINALSPDLITKKIRGSHFVKKHGKQLAEFSKTFGGVLIGPGITPKLGFANEFAKAVKTPVIFDADALKTVSLRYVHDAILTPHAKEFDILLKNNGYESLAKKVKSLPNNSKKASLIQEEMQTFLKNNNVILLKGKDDLVISASKVFINRTGNSGMTVGGTGDVLAGLCLGYLVQIIGESVDCVGDVDVFRAASLAAYNCGKIGDMLLKRYDLGYIASDFIKEISRLKKVRGCC